MTATVKARFANDGENKLTFVSGGNRDVMDAGYMDGSHVYDMSVAQYETLMRLVSQDSDGSEIPYEVRPHGNGVRIYQF